MEKFIFIGVFYGNSFLVEYFIQLVPDDNKPVKPYTHINNTEL